MRKASGFVFEGAIELASEVIAGGDFSRLSLAAEVSDAEGKWDLRGVDEVLPETSNYEPISRTQDVTVYRLDPTEYDRGVRVDGEPDSRVILVRAVFPKFSGYAREVTLFVRGGARYDTGIVAAIQRFPRVWLSDSFLFCAKFALDMRG